MAENSEATSEATSVDDIAHDDKKLEQKVKDLVGEIQSVHDQSLLMLSSQGRMFTWIPKRRWEQISKKWSLQCAQSYLRKMVPGDLLESSAIQSTTWCPVRTKGLDM